MSQLSKKVKNLELSAKKRRQGKFKKLLALVDFNTNLSPTDFDPEEESFARQAISDDESGSEEPSDEDLSREHYQKVGQSKLRKPAKTKLDQKKYGGQAVSRSKIFQDDDEADVLAPEEDEDEDPFAIPNGEASGSAEDDMAQDENDLLDGDEAEAAVDADEEIDSDEAFESGEENHFRGKGFVFRGSGKDLKTLPTGSEDDEDSEAEVGSDSGSLENLDQESSDINMENMVEDDSEISGDEEESLEDEDEMTEEDDESEDDEQTAGPRPSTIKVPRTTDRETIKALISNDTAALASSLSASLSADARKGAAVKSQYQTFDRLLDARIKLQKGLTASDDVYQNANYTDEESQNAMQKAEEAALKLYATLESFRSSLIEATSGSDSSKKRKRPAPPTTETSTSDLWNRLSNLESQSVPIRKQVLDKWSTKTRSAAPMAASKSSSSLINSARTEPQLSTVLTTYLNTESSKLQNTAQPQPSAYDDTVFYQSLLRELINSRASASTSLQNTALPIVPMKLHPSGNSARKRTVDTKASKGRRIRYTVHEKLENFMASEGRGNAVGQWNDGAVREFFASLLGQRGVLGEEMEHEDEEIDGGEGDREVQALRLFRT